MTRGSWLTGFATLLVLGGAVSARAQASAPAKSGATPRGIYLAGSALGVSAEIEIERDGKRGLVPPTFEFRSGDKFWLQVTTNRSGYIYVLNRTLVGDPQGAASRGIKLMQQEDIKRPPSPDAYTMVYPAPNTAAALVKAHVTTRIPAGNQFFVMDDMIGAEKLMVVAADKPSDIVAFFDKSTGKLARSANANDSASSVLNRLNTELATMADNTQTEETPRSRSIVIKPLPGTPGSGTPAISAPPGSAPGVAPVTPPSGTGGAATPNPTQSVPKVASKPILQELTLVHVAR